MARPPRYWTCSIRRPWIRPHRRCVSRTVADPCRTVRTARDSDGPADHRGTGPRPSVTVAPHLVARADRGEKLSGPTTLNKRIRESAFDSHELPTDPRIRRLRIPVHHPRTAGPHVLHPVASALRNNHGTSLRRATAWYFLTGRGPSSHSGMSTPLRKVTGRTHLPVHRP